MNASILFLVALGFCFISCVLSEAVIAREILAPAVPVTQRKLLIYPTFIKPLFNQHQQLYYPQYVSPSYPQYTNGFLGAGYQQQLGGQEISLGNGLGGYQQQAVLGQQSASGSSLGGFQQQGLGLQTSSGASLGGYQQQALGQQNNFGTSLGGYQQQALGTQISSGTSLGGYQKPLLSTQISSGSSLDLSGLGLGGIPNLNVDLITALKPIGGLLETVVDTNGHYGIYGKKK